MVGLWCLTPLNFDLVIHHRHVCLILIKFHFFIYFLLFIMYRIKSPLGKWQDRNIYRINNWFKAHFYGQIVPSNSSLCVNQLARSPGTSKTGFRQVNIMKEFVWIYRFFSLDLAFGQGEQIKAKTEIRFKLYLCTCFKHKFHSLNTSSDTFDANDRSIRYWKHMVHGLILLVTSFHPDQFYTRTYFTSNSIPSKPILYQDLFY